MTAALMIQGTGSDVGKSVLVAGLCRLFSDRGLRVRPFKPQNMSNNAAATADGGEIGRAQALQAQACRTPPSVHMNPVLLKPQSDRTAQLIVHGRPRGMLDARNFGPGRGPLLAPVLDSFASLKAEADLVIVEGAGSPAEINLREGDIANMGFARPTGTPVILVGDIDRGGVIAALVGTKAVLDPADAAMIRGFLVNKFRGDVGLFHDGYRAIETRTGWDGMGIVPWIAAVRALPAEDAVPLERLRPGSDERIVVAAPLLPCIANFDDLDALAAEPAIRLEMVPPGSPLPAEARLIILPGSKATIRDLAFLRDQGWDIDLRAHLRRGGNVLGLCGGYQMLGVSIADPLGLEGPAATVNGLGLLPVETTLEAIKQVRPVGGISLANGLPFQGYEIHCGRTRLQPGTGAASLLQLEDGSLDGARSPDGRVAGCYVHRLFDDPRQRAAWLGRLGATSDGIAQAQRVEEALDQLAASLTACVEVDRLLALAEEAP